MAVAADRSLDDWGESLTIVARSAGTIESVLPGLALAPNLDGEYPIIEPTLTRPPRRSLDLHHVFVAGISG